MSGFRELVGTIHEHVIGVLRRPGQHGFTARFNMNLEQQVSQFLLTA